MTENNGKTEMRILDPPEAPLFIYGETANGERVRVRVQQCNCDEAQKKQGE